MRLLFIDESGRIGQDGLFALGGAPFEPRSGASYEPAGSRGSSSTDGILRTRSNGHGIRTGYVPPTTLADVVVDGLSRAPFVAYVTLLDLERGAAEEPEFFGSAERTNGTALMFFSERFHHLLDAEETVGLVLADSRHRREDMSLRRYFGALTESGTPYMKLDRIVEGLFLGPSHLSVSLHCADLIVSIAAAAERGTPQARGYLKKLLQRFATHPATGELERVGIKHFPDVRRDRAPHKLF